uniref:Uncharacterized protein n=1 Tax=Anopheles atroparvus TaxID=41427 RepID=A0AAG5DDH6_ANOAO
MLINVCFKSFEFIVFPLHTFYRCGVLIGPIIIYRNHYVFAIINYFKCTLCQWLR